MRIFGLVQDSIVDGPGFRFSCFVQGCPHHCPGCHNPESHDPRGGKEMTVEEVEAELLKNPLTDGLTLSGGAIMMGSYSGWTFEHLWDAGTEAQRALLAELDVLVDGPFLLAERTLSLPWRGSRNQRVIDVPASLAAGAVIVLPGGESR